jgi:hypothetical protein
MLGSVVGRRIKHHGMRVIDWTLCGACGGQLELWTLPDDNRWVHDRWVHVDAVGRPQDTIRDGHHPPKPLQHNRSQMLNERENRCGTRG